MASHSYMFSILIYSYMCTTYDHKLLLAVALNCQLTSHLVNLMLCAAYWPTSKILFLNGDCLKKLNLLLILP